MKYELDKETAAMLRRTINEWHGTLTNLLQRTLKSAEGQDEIAAIQSEIAKANRRRDEVLVTLDKREGA